MPRSNKVTVKSSQSPADPGALPAVRVGSPRWSSWLARHEGFFFEGVSGHLTARREMRRGCPYWYAYRRRGRRLCKIYLGKPEALTSELLEQACARLAGQTSLARAADASNPLASISASNTLSSISSIPPVASEGTLSFLPLTKVNPPAFPQTLVERPRLTQRMNAHLTLLTAPSGFGKSTLLNEWRRTCNMPVAWVSLDADDNHPLRFWSTIVAALQTIYPNFGQDMQLHLRTPSPADLSEIVVSLTNAIVRTTSASDSAPRLGLILDDYQHIQDRGIHTSLQFWLDYLPTAMQLIISSHTKPSLTLGHLRGKGMVSEIQTEDLRFTLEEGIAFLSKHSGARTLAYGEKQTLVKRTEGWAAGLTLATLALSQAVDQRQPQEAFSGAHIYLRDYFVEHVLSRQPSSMQEFMLKTAILKHLTGSLCDAVTGRTDGSEMLSRLWRKNLFLVRLEEPEWYRYHDLFAETLSNQLRQRFPGEVPRLHHRAAEWYRSHNAPDDAVHHLLAVEAWEEAASLIENIALLQLERFGDYSQLLSWLQQLPGAVLQQHKTLLRVYVRIAALALSRNEVDQFLTRIEMNITHKPITERTPDEESVLAEIHRIRRFWLTSDLVLSPSSKDGEPDSVWQMLNGIALYARYLRRDFEQAAAMASELYESSKIRRHLYVMLIAGGGLAFLLLFEGYLRRSEKIARQVLQQAIAQRGKLPEPASIALAASSQVCYERNQLVQAHQLLLRAAEVDPNPLSSNMPIIESILRAKIQSAQGESDSALATLQTARELQAKHPSGLYRDQDLAAYQAWVSVRRGDFVSAERLLDEAGRSETHSLSAIVRAELLLEQDQPAAAAEMLNELIRRYPRGFYLEPILGARILLALALFAQHQLNHARRAMAEVVRLAGPESFLRPFLDYRRRIVPLLTLLLHTPNLTPSSQSYLRQVLREVGSSDGGLKPPIKAELTTLLASASVTRRERQVLQLVSDGLSNREIATQFSVSDSTVKTHLKNLYRKLGASSRTQALAHARAIQLL